MRTFLLLAALLVPSLAFAPVGGLTLRDPAYVAAFKAAAAAGGFASAATFDGSFDYLSRGADLTGNADSKVGTISIWFRWDGLGAEQHLLGVGTTGEHLQVWLSSGGDLRIDAHTNSPAGIGMRLTSTVQILDTAWHHLMASWDMTDTGKRHMYLDGADVISPIIYNNTTIDYTGDDWKIGSRGDPFGKWNGCISEIWFTPAEYLDMSDSGNRAKFYNAGAPVEPGATGSTPTGTSPLIYVRTWSGNYNSGTGGAFTLTGTLDACTAP